MVYKIELWRWFMRRFNAAYNNYLTWHGFDTVKFDNEVIQSGDACALDVCKERFGPVAAKFIQAAASWMPKDVPTKDSVIEFDSDKPDDAAEIKAMGLDERHAWRIHTPKSSEYLFNGEGDKIMSRERAIAAFMAAHPKAEFLRASYAGPVLG